MNKPFSFQRGETILLALDATTGDPTIVTDVSADIRKYTWPRQTFDRSDTVGMPLDVVFRDADSDNPAGWTFTLDAASCAELDPGMYGVDARITVGSGVIVTDPPLLIKITEPATVPE